MYEIICQICNYGAFTLTHIANCDSAMYSANHWSHDMTSFLAACQKQIIYNNYRWYYNRTMSVCLIVEHACCGRKQPAGWRPRQTIAPHWLAIFISQIVNSFDFIQPFLFTYLHWLNAKGRHQDAIPAWLFCFVDI